MKFVHFSDLHIDANTGGKRDPETGIHLRVLDTVKNLDVVVDFAIAKRVDAVFFSGDAYHSPHPRQEHKILLQKRIKQLSDHNIPFIAVIGNHDRIKREYFKHPLSDFETLGIDNVYVSDEIELVEFKNFIVYQIPWQYGAVKLETIEADKPIIINAHCTVLGSTYQTDIDTSEMVLGPDFILEQEQLEFADYVALGHIHRQQVVDGVKMVYPGSVEANTWGELGDHGFVYGEFDRKNLTYEIINFETRKRYDLEFEVTTNKEFFNQLPEIDPEGLYRIRIRWKDHNTLNRVKLEKILNKAFGWKLEESKPRFNTQHRRELEDLDNKSPIELISLYFEKNGIKFDKDFEDLFFEVEQDVIS